jgi:hypothetical protein
VLAVVLVAGLLAVIVVQLGSGSASAPATASPSEAQTSIAGGSSSACDLAPRELLRVWGGPQIARLGACDEDLGLDLSVASFGTTR